MAVKGKTCAALMLLLVGLLLISVEAPAAAGSPGAAPRTVGPDAVPGQVIVGYAPGVTARAVGRARRRGEIESVRALGLARTELTRTGPGQSVTAAIAELEADPAVVYAEPNYLRRLMTAIPPDDPHFEFQWGLHNTEQFIPASGAPLGFSGVKGTPGADIDALLGWSMASSAPNTVVAVIDSGVAIDHPDLAGQIWVNEGEIGTGSDDDDGNGFAGDIHGWDFVEDTPDVRDPNGHGTHVAGIIGATGDNGIGVAGVSHDVRIMPLRVCDVNGSCPTDLLADAIKYAADNGADVVNMSLGGPDFSETTRNAMALADDLLFVAAAGNDGTNNDQEPLYPCNDDEEPIGAPIELEGGVTITEPPTNLICVAASDHKDARPSFSNFGEKSVDLAAPGLRTASTYPALVNAFEEDFANGSSWDVVDLNAGPVSDRWELIAGQQFEGGHAITDSRGSNYEPGIATATLTGPGADLSGFNRCQFEYRYALDTVLVFEGEALVAAESSYLVVELSLTGQPNSWEAIDAIGGQTANGGEGFESWTVELDDFAGAEDVRIRFRLVVGGQAEPRKGATVDELFIDCLEPDGEEYAALSGTSMAAPHVAGVASIVREEVPNLDPAEVKAVILDGVDPLQAFEGKTVSGGRLNLASTLEAIGLEPPGDENGGGENGGGNGDGETGDGGENGENGDGGEPVGSGGGSGGGDGGGGGSGSQAGPSPSQDSTGDAAAGEPVSEAGRRLRILRTRSRSRGRLVARLRVAEPGAIRAAAYVFVPRLVRGQIVRRAVVLARGRTSATAAGDLRVRLAPTARGRRILSRSGRTPVVLAVKLQPSAGSSPVRTGARTWLRP